MKVRYVHVSVTEKELTLLADAARSMASAMSFLPEMKRIFESDDDEEKEEGEASTTKDSTPSSP